MLYNNLRRSEKKYCKNKGNFKLILLILYPVLVLVSTCIAVNMYSCTQEVYTRTSTLNITVL